MQRGLRQFSRGVAGVVTGSGKGGYIPRSTSGVFRFGSAVVSCSDSRPEPPAPLAGFSLAPRLALAVAVDSVAAIHRVKGACHVIVAPLMARGAAEHGLADWWGGPGAWRASRRCRPASGAGAGPSSGRARRAGPVDCGAPWHRVHHAGTNNLLGKAPAATGLKADFAPRHYRIPPTRRQAAEGDFGRFRPLER